MERRNADIGDGFTETFKREMGFSHPRSITRRISASEGLVRKLDLYGKINGHEGCVNAVEFNSTGDQIVSGSDDRQVMLWNWAAKTRILTFPSGHWENVFQTRIMPFTDDRKIVTSAADGQVRLAQILENGQVATKRLGKHHGRVYKLAVEPGSPHILYSCGEDGLVQHFDLRCNSSTKLFYCCSFTQGCRKHSRRIRINAISIDPRNPKCFSIGGSDEYARVYDIRRCQWGLAYSNTSELLVSYNDELIYLFQRNMGLGSSPLSIPPEWLQKAEEPQAYEGHRNAQTVKGVSFFGPNDEYVMSGSDCGHIFIWKKKGAKLVRLVVGDRRVVNQLEAHPYIPVLATCGMEKNIKIWAPMSNDVRPLPENVDKIMESNRHGRDDHSRVTLTPDIIMHVLRLQRRQALAYVERRYDRADVESDEEGEASYSVGLSDGDEFSERDCNIS